MTTTSAQACPSDTRGHYPFVDWALASRGRPSVIADLRRGDQPALADRAMPHLAPWLPGKLTRNGASRRMDAMLLFAAAASRYAGISDATNISLGRAARRSLGGDSAQDSGTGTRIIGVQRQRLVLAHRSLASIYTRIEESPQPYLDWHQTWAMYRAWDDPRIESQRKTRRRLLTDFFAGSEDPSTDPTEQEN